MALIRYAEGQQRSGSIGGSVYSRNRFGAYIRARSIPVNPNTDRQVAVRNAVRFLSIRWQISLTQAQRDAWGVYAANVTWKNALSMDVKLTALNHYIRSNTTQQSLAFPIQDTAPAIMDIAASEAVLGCTASEATQILTITFDDTEVWASEAGAFQHFYLGLPQNGGIKFFGGPYRYIVSVAGVTPAVSPLPATAPFQIKEGERLWVKSRILRADGRLSEFAQTDFLCAA